MRNNGGKPVPCGAERIVVHYAARIVKFAKVANSCVRVCVEVALRSNLNILPCYANEIVALRSTMHVIKSQRMQEFVNNGTNSEAAILGFI